MNKSKATRIAQLHARIAVCTRGQSISMIDLETLLGFCFMTGGLPAADQ
jgi:hypothetical protein